MAAADEWGRDQFDANAREPRFLAIEQHAVYELRNAGDQARRCVALGDRLRGSRRNHDGWAVVRRPSPDVP